MHKLIDKLVLLGLCLLALTLTEIRWASIIVLLAAIAVSALNSYFENRLPMYLSVLYAAVCFIVPGFTIFLPLIVYDCAGADKWIFRLFWCVALPMSIFAGGWQVAAITTLSSGMAFLLQYRTSAEIRTQNDFYMLTDDAKEKAAFLERERRELLDKQDYEVRLATLAERNRIAREIHDNVGHLLTRSILQLDALRITCAGDARLTGETNMVKTTLSDAMDSIRDSIHEIYDESVNLRLQLETMADGFKFCAVKIRYDAGMLPVELRICFAAIAREALSNIAKHSNATEAVITVTEHPAFCQMIVWDNGTIKPDGIAKGIGLQSMEDRVIALDGVFRAEFSNGFRVFISIPKEAGM